MFNRIKRALFHPESIRYIDVISVIFISLYANMLSNEDIRIVHSFEQIDIKLTIQMTVLFFLSISLMLIHKNLTIRLERSKIEFQDEIINYSIKNYLHQNNSYTARKDFIEIYYDYIFKENLPLIIFIVFFVVFFMFYLLFLLRIFIIK